MNNSLFNLALRVQRRVKWWTTPKHYTLTTTSFSQCGEDRIMAFVFMVLGVGAPIYLDIGANDPKYLSNTYLFYRHGCKGVLVEPNPTLFNRLQSVRPRDICLNVGVGPQEGMMPFYEYDSAAAGLSTFSEQEVREGKARHHHKVKQVRQMPVVTINSILEEYFPTPPNLLSIDVEGLDTAILQSLDYARFAPDVICTETLLHGGGRSTKDEVLPKFLSTKGYRLYADTYVNSIFIRSDRFPSFYPRD